MTLKTYGVNSLMEWHLSLPCGRMKIHIEFTGGRGSGYCVLPARYSTHDPVVQKAIENSPHFKRGKIRLLSEKELDLPDPTTQNPRSSATDSAGSTAEPRVVDVPDLSSARQQLIRLTGVNPQRVRTRAEMEQLAAEHNITLKISGN